MAVLVVIGMILFYVVTEYINLIQTEKDIDMIELEDDLTMNLDKPLLVERYTKLNKKKFESYPMVLTTDLNKKIFEKFNEVYKGIEDKGYEDLDSIHILFINKVRGYLNETNEQEYNVIVKNGLLPFGISGDYVNIIDEALELDYDKMAELNLDGVINFNSKKFFLSDLTSIVIKRDKSENKIALIMQFGAAYEGHYHASFNDALRYIFKNKKADIRLIQKITNSAMIFTSEKDGDI